MGETYIHLIRISSDRILPTSGGGGNNTTSRKKSFSLTCKIRKIRNYQAIVSPLPWLPKNAGHTHRVHLSSSVLRRWSKGGDNTNMTAIMASAGGNGHAKGTQEDSFCAHNPCQPARAPTLRGKLNGRKHRQWSLN